MDPSFKKGLNTFFLLKFSQTSFMTFQLGIEKSLDGIANYFIRCGLYIKKKVNQVYGAFQLGTEKSLDGIANYFIRCGLYINK